MIHSVFAVTGAFLSLVGMIILYVLVSAWVRVPYLRMLVSYSAAFLGVAFIVVGGVMAWVGYHPQIGWAEILGWSSCTCRP